MPENDLLGRPLTATEADVLAIYTTLKTLASRTDLPPCVERNAKQALACMWQAVNDLDLDFEQLYDVGI
jgi:hypothetical protein